MTREEAIARVKHQRDWANEVNRTLDAEAFEMATKALEQEPTTKNDLGVDCVSRQAVDRLVWEYLRKATDETIAFYEHLLDLPSVTPQEQYWIPVTERLPQESRMFLVTLVDKEDDYVCIDVAWYAHPNDYSIEFGEWREVPTGEKVIAWMLLPEPFKTESEGMG